jgi:DNA-directed RNA polymerase
LAFSADASRIEQRQVEREQREQDRARSAATASHRQLKEQGAESRLRYGQVLFQERCDLVAKGVNDLLCAYWLNPGKPGRNASAVPLVAQFGDPAKIAAIALATVIDKLTRRMKFPAVCQNVGYALELEYRAMRLEGKEPLGYRRMRSKFKGNRRHLVSDRMMELLGCPTLKWTNRERFEAGALLVDLINDSTDLLLIENVRRGVKNIRMVGPSAKALEFIQACPPRSYMPTRTPMLCPPRPWTGIRGGGHLTNDQLLVKVPLQDMGDREEEASKYLEKADLRQVLQAVNTLQDTPMQIDPWIVDIQRQAWEYSIRGLFPCTRTPRPMPEPLGEGATELEWKIRNKEAWKADRDLRENGPRRVKIERSIQLCEEAQGETIWQAYYLDYRSRLFTSNRYASHQSEDHEKACLSFAQRMPVNQEALDWMLIAAAGHDGCGRMSWAERRDLGRREHRRYIAIGEDPLNRLEQWRASKDTWQFLQICRELYLLSQDPGHLSGVPIRLDQTTSGCGHLAALARDSEVGRFCNLWGTTPSDLYEHIAQKVTQRLLVDLQDEDPKVRALAAKWLKIGVDRSWTKHAVLSTPYGASALSIQEGLMDQLEELIGEVEPRLSALLLAYPCRYLTKMLRQELLQVVAPCMAVSEWLRLVARKVVKAGHPMQWTTPTGFPVRIAERTPVKARVAMSLFGRKSYCVLMDQPPEAVLSARLICKGVSAGYIHGMDAALCQMVVCRAAGLGMPMLTNHDCFATVPAWANRMHSVLHDELRELYKTDWLTATRAEIIDTTGVSKLPQVPLVGTLSPGAIGTSPYCFM